MKHCRCRLNVLSYDIKMHGDAWEGHVVLAVLSGVPCSGFNFEMEVMASFQYLYIPLLHTL